MKGIGADPTRTTIRFSFGKFNTADDILKTVQTLTQWYPAAENLNQSL
jgi:cysteine sulfinate desulfinase/cysteine desulfurase-like protein